MFSFNRLPRAYAALAVFACVAMAASHSAHAEDFPTRPVRIIVPYGTGGGADGFARTIGHNLEKAWGQGVAVDNRAGAAGNIGTMEAVRAKPDGYTLLLQNVTLATNYAVNGKLPYSPTTDLTPILMLGSTPHAIVAHPSANIATLAELVAAARANPGKLTYASCGIGTPHHFAMEVLRQARQFEMQHVGYKGCAPALPDVLGGQVPIAIVSANLVVPYLASGKLKVLAVTSAKRYPLLPGVPTVQETGVPDFDYDTWYALMGPAKMPAPLVAKITADVSQVLDDPAVRKTLTDMGIEVKKGPAQELTRRIVDDSARYLELARKNNIKPE